MKITSDLLAKLVPGTSAAKRDRFLPFLNDACPRFEINTELRLAAFLATCIVESDHFKATEEYGKGKGRYYSKPDAVTGKVYYGRGIIQTTHKANYKAFTDFIKESDHEEKPNFVLHPELLAEPYWAVESACYFWQSNNLNKYADRGQFFETQGLVNRGSARKEALGYDERLALYRKALKLLPDNFSFDSISAAEQAEPTTVPDTIPAENPPVITSDSNPEPPPIEAPTDQKSIVTKTQETITNVSDGVSQVQTSIEKVTSTTATVSKSSIFTIVWKNVLAVGAFIIGFVEENWEWIVLGAVILIVAAWLWDRAKTRANERALKN